jgi:hypothetical protein
LNCVARVKASFAGTAHIDPGESAEARKEEAPAFGDAPKLEVVGANNEDLSIPDYLRR